MNWHEQKEQFQKRFDNLGEKKNDDVLTNLKSATAKYISSNDKNTSDYNNIIQYVSKESQNDMSTLLTESGDIQKKIHKLEKVQNEIKVDVESAIARDNLLRSRDTDMSRHKLFLLERPVRKGIIPYLWVTSVLFIGIGLVIYRMTFPNFGTGSGGSVPSLIMEFITSKIVLGSLLVSALIVIIFLSLKIAGII